MLTCLVILLKVLQWSKFHYIKNKEELILGFDATILTKYLTIDTLPNNIQSRLDLIYSLHQKNYSNKEIANHLNLNNIKSPSGIDYNQGLVWCTLSKYKKRLERILYKDIQISKPIFYEKC